MLKTNREISKIGYYMHTANSDGATDGFILYPTPDGESLLSVMISMRKTCQSTIGEVWWLLWYISRNDNVEDRMKTLNSMIPTVSIDADLGIFKSLDILENSTLDEIEQFVPLIFSTHSY